MMVRCDRRVVKFVKDRHRLLRKASRGSSYLILYGKILDHRKRLFVIRDHGCGALGAGTQIEAGSKRMTEDKRSASNPGPSFQWPPAVNPGGVGAGAAPARPVTRG